MSASSCFKVQNDTEEQVFVSIGASKTHTYGCSGHDENKCKLALFVDGKEICQSAHNACSKSMIVMKDRSSVTVERGRQKGKFLCQIR